ncbi:helix-turn-helix domain-containing protein [Chitinophaga barathri]|uniref:AraC family transcriptional regulator n=1 Tax=Chitinophaga barathri TaxID=1647451 RepID=A0A3N4MDU3_9BACT|nr:AraC family transcriptional regulator [Chitinophaga barathri]RPD41525.1 AraC family transcriptional regulator [Chitinophaga barathri]
MDNDLHYNIIKPGKNLSDFVDSFWFLHNRSGSNKETIGLPDGRIDLSLYKSATDPFRIVLLGVGTHYIPTVIPAGACMFVVSFKLLAVEYLFRETISDIVNYGKNLPPGFWGFSETDLERFDKFVEKTTKTIESLLPEEIDKRKQNLFELIYASKGSITVKELSEKVFWSSRQINRYFNQQFGISLKTYCSILRFRASLEHIAEGKLFPRENYFDQTHFIKEIKKFTGVVPKELLKNKNDRFILLSSLTSK